jgi:hypothetical protein
MHENVLHPAQLSLATILLKEFKTFYLCGGTAIALQIGHRKSIDFDLATPGPIHAHTLINKILRSGFPIEHTMVSTEDELTLAVGGVKLTFFSFPFDVHADQFWKNAQIKMPDLLFLGSMKAYALGRRCKWKDYVDLYFLIREYVSLPALIGKSEQLYKGAFNSKLFLEQLCYFKDIDMTESVEYVISAPGNDEIRHFLTEIAISG